MTDTIDRLYAGDILKYDETPEGLMVHGKAVSSMLDMDQQISDPKWLASEMPAWMSWGNVREQHTAVAAGVGRELTEGAKAGDWHLKALIVDPNTQAKIRAGVLKGFSIGIKGTQIIKTKEAPRGRIVGGKIVEISVVDRPCIPDALLDVPLAKSVDGSLEAVEAGSVVWSTDAQGNETTKAVTLDSTTDVDTKALNGQTDPATQQARDAAVDCPLCGGDGKVDERPCPKCIGTGKVPMNPTEESPDSVPGPETGTTPKDVEPDPLPDEDVTLTTVTTPDGSQTAYTAVHTPSGTKAVGFTEDAARKALAADVAKAAAPPVDKTPDAALSDALADVAQAQAEEAERVAKALAAEDDTDSPAGDEDDKAIEPDEAALIREYVVCKALGLDHEQYEALPADEAERTFDTLKSLEADAEKHATPKVACPQCKGKGKIRAGKVDCPTCGGDKTVTQAVAEKYTAKKSAKTDKAEKAAPVDLSRATAGSALARAFLRSTAALQLSAADAVSALAEVSKTLEAEVLKGDKCPMCDGDGVQTVKDQCATCKGTGKASDGSGCAACDGKGMIKTQETCSACDGSGKTGSSKATQPDDAQVFAIQVSELDPDAEDYLTRLGALKATAKTLVGDVSRGTDDEKAELPALVLALDPSAEDFDAKSEELAEVAKKQFSDAERAALAKKGQAIPIRDSKGEVTSGSFPIPDVASLKDAISSISRAKDPAAAKAHIEKRAKALGREDLIPDGWKAVDADKAADPGTWTHDPAVLAQTRNNIAQLMQAELDELMAGECEIGDLYNLLATLTSFLDWWSNEAWNGEDPPPFGGNDTEDDVSFLTLLGVDADTIKAASADNEDEEARTEAQKSARKQLRKALGIDTKSQKVAIDEAAKAAAQEVVDPLKERLETVEKMAAPGGPKRSRTREEDTKASEKDELAVKIAVLEKTIVADTDPDLKKGHREDLVKLRAEMAAL
jgi:uncharacterized Zn finger protein (UPF0148 family)